jgi:hypothetical protein
MQTQAATTLGSFIQGFIADDEDDDEDTKDPKDLMKEYSTDLLKSLEEMLKKGIQSNYEALTLKVLENIQMVAKVIDSDFAQYY